MLLVIKSLQLLVAPLGRAYPAVGHMYAIRPPPVVCLWCPVPSGESSCCWHHSSSYTINLCAEGPPMASGKYSRRERPLGDRVRISSNPCPHYWWSCCLGRSLFHSADATAFR